MGKGAGMRFTGGDVEIALQRDSNGLITQGMAIGEITALNQQRILAAGSRRVSHRSAHGSGHRPVP